MSTTTTKPTHEQGQLHLQVYDLRREAKLRQARDWYFRNYFVEKFEDSNRIAPPGSESGALVMQVLGYWEHACALLNYGLLHEDLFFETSGEFFGVWERVKPIIAEGRTRFANPLYLAHLEKAADRYEACSDSRIPVHIPPIRQVMKRMQTQFHTHAPPPARPCPHS